MDLYVSANSNRTASNYSKMYQLAVREEEGTSSCTNMMYYIYTYEISRLTTLLVQFLYFVRVKNDDGPLYRFYYQQRKAGQQCDTLLYYSLKKLTTMLLSS